MFFNIILLHKFKILHISEKNSICKSLHIAEHLNTKALDPSLMFNYQGEVPTKS